MSTTGAAANVNAPEQRAARGAISKNLLPIGAITVLAILARIFSLNKSLRLDEGSSVEIVRGIFLGGHSHTWASFWSVLWNHELNMAFYYVLLRLWMHFGSGAVYLRLPSVVLGVCSVPLVFILGKRLFDRRVALVAALLLAVHSVHAGFSQEMRAYPLFVFWIILSYLLFLRAAEKPTAANWALYALAGSVAVYIHFFALFVFPAQYVAVLWLPRRSPALWRGLLASAAFIAVTAVPVFIFVLTKDTDQLAWITSTWAGVPKTVVLLAGSSVMVPVAGFLWYLAIRNWRRDLESGSSLATWHQALVIAWLVVPFALVLMCGLRRPILSSRFMLFCVPAAVLLAAQGLFGLPQKRRRIVLIAACILSFASVVFAYFTPREDWQGAARYVIAQSTAGDVVSVVPEWTHHPFDFYWRRWGRADVSRAQLPEEPGELDASLDKMSAAQDRLWLVVSTGSKDARSSAAVIELKSALAAHHYRLLASRDFHDVLVETYQGPAHP